MCDNDYSYVPKFNLGQLCDSTTAAECLSNEDVMVALGRHLVGDWGLVKLLGYVENVDAIARGSGQIVSAYCTAYGEDFYVVTDLGMKQTVVILAREAAPKYAERVRRAA